MRLLLLLGMSVALSACYTVDQARYNSFVLDTVRPGLPMAQAAGHLAEEGFHCSGATTAASLTCTRVRQSLYPFSCVERVTLLRRAGTNTVGEVEIPPIACAGL